MLKIWGRKNSSNVRKALWIAQELGLDFESIDAGGAPITSTTNHNSNIIGPPWNQGLEPSQTA